MTRERFEDLAEAFGGDISRWPAEAREEAALLMAQEPAFTQGVLGRANALDAALDGLAFAPASIDLTDRIVASAPAPRRAKGWRGWLLPAGLGASLAAACAAGVLVGAQVSAQFDTGGDVAAASTVADLDVSGLSEEV